MNENSASRLLIVEDNQSDVTHYQRLLERTSLQFDHVDSVSTLDEANHYLSQFQPNCCLLDFNLPDGNALTFIENIDIPSGSSLLSFPVIIITGQKDIQTAVGLLRVGASDYLVKNSLDEHTLERSIQHTFKIYNLQKNNEFLALHDGLTGLANRSLFTNKLHNLVLEQKRYNRSFALIYIDLDFFKQINDRHGHDAGDHLLEITAEVLCLSVRDSDTIARLGGDEFAVLLPDIDQNKAHSVAHTIVEAISNRKAVWRDTHLSLSASVGLACFPGDAQDEKTLMRQADIALFESKKNGRGRYTSVNKTLVEREDTVWKIREQLEVAINQHELSVAYQPICNLKDNQISEVEALVRWEFMGNYLPPEQIIEHVLDLGLSHIFHEWLFDKTLNQLSVWNNSAPIKMAINFPVTACEDEKIVNQLILAMEKHDISPKNVIVEITEDYFMQSPEKSIRQLETLSNLGVKIAIDDFGTGFSSMQYLGDLPCTRLKIDKSFFINLHKNNKNSQIIKAITALAHNLNLEVVAEGIENLYLFEKAKEYRCDLIQGFWFGYPIEADNDFSSFIHASKNARGTQEK